MFKTISTAFGPIADVIGRLSKTQKIIFASLILTAIAGVTAVPLTKADNVVFNGPRDCNDNSILYCGAMNVGELQQKYNASPNAQTVYQFYGIDSADMGRLQNTAKAGKVYKNGNVVVNGQVVATNSVSAGWNVFPGTTPVTFNGVTFHDSPNSASFLSDSIDAYVVMDNGVFAFAILSSCGNPVGGKAGTHEYKLDKTVKKAGGAWVKTTPVNYGEVYEYKVEVVNTGTGHVRWVSTKDVLPADQKVVPGSLTLNGAYLPESHLFEGNGSFINRLAPGNKLTYIFKATTAQATQPDPCTNKQSVNVANASALLMPNLTSNASVTLECKEKPVENPDYTILKQVQTIGSDKWVEDVTVPSGTEVRYRVVITSTGKAPATNVIASDKLPTGVTYKAGTLKKDNNNVNEADAGKFFGSGLNIGTLAPSATATFTFNAIAGTTDQAKCVAGQANNIASITADKLPKKEDNALVNVTCKPAEKISCDMLTATSLGNRKFQYKVTYTATQGATFQTASYNFGDNSNALVTDKTTVEHTYAKDGIFTTTVELTFLVNGKQQKVTSDNCKVTVQASTPPAMCTIPGKQHLPANSPECAQDVVVPTVIPNTGAGSLIALFVGSSIISTFAYRFWISKNQV